MIPSKTRTVFLAVSFAVVILVFNGCRDVTSGYDQRLTVADSVMRHHPDSALQLLEAIDAKALTKQADRAYHALLLTQARYRCYVTATSDSAINIALDYYQRHKDETEKLTRAYIYKGAVMEELGQAESAMTYYKRAISNAASDDYFNQGYARFRIGSIYRDNMVADSAHINRMKEALYYFKLVPDSFYILSSLVGIGSSYISLDKDSAIVYLNQANTLAKRLKEKELEQINLTQIADLKMYSNDIADIKQAKDIAVSLLNDSTYSGYKREHLLMVAALTTAKLNLSESAKHFLDQVDSASLSPYRLIFFNNCCAELARNRGDIRQFQHYYDASHNLSDSLATNSLQQQLREVEAKYDNEALKYEKLRYKIFWVISLLVTGLIVSVLAILLIVARKKSAQRKRQLQESNDTIERMAGDSARLATLLQDNRAMSEELKQVIRHQIDVFTLLVEQHHTKFTRAPKKFSELFQKSYDVNQPDKSFWTGLHAYADSVCGGIITHTLTDCPELSKTDVNFLSLYCCDLPSTVIMVCMGYNDVHSVYNKKRRVAEALQLDGSLDDYVQLFKPGDVAEQET